MLIQTQSPHRRLLVAIAATMTLGVALAACGDEDEPAGPAMDTNNDDGDNAANGGTNNGSTGNNANNGVDNAATNNNNNGDNNTVEPIVCDDPLPEHLGYSAAFRATLANPAPPEHAEGERIFFEGTFGTEGESWPPAEWLVQLWQGDTERWGEQFSSYGFLVDPGDDLPVGIKRGDVDPTEVHETCAACHVARLDDGRIWAGMPPVDLRWGAFRADLNAAWVAMGNPALISENAATKFARIPPGSTDAGSARSSRLIPINIALLVNLAERDNLNYQGASRNAMTESWISIFTFGAGSGDVPFPGPCTTGPFDAYLDWLVSPEAPPADATLTARGAEVFEEARCSACHHPDDLMADEPADWVEGPELLPGDDEAFPHGTIATDGALASLGGGGGGGDEMEDEEGDDRVLEIILFILDNGLVALPTGGYSPPDLHGVWATAPYLHNGSVPTLEALLLPVAERPSSFEHAGFTVDTTTEGLSNQGHAFGTDLSDEDKAALVAFLESL